MDQEMTTFNAAATKTLEQQFVDWESHVFGFGYGSGEPHIIPALRLFLSKCTGGTGRQYDFNALETILNKAIVWLLINTLCHSNIINYGCSPRFGWLTDKGVALRDFMLSKTDNELVSLIADRPEDYIPCTPDACNCGPNGYEEGRVCTNAFWGGKSV